MKTDNSKLDHAIAYGRRWSAGLDALADSGQRMAYFQHHLPVLLADVAAVRGLLAAMADGRTWPNLKRTGLFDHEVLLYLDPANRFSLRLYFHLPDRPTDIHDHTAWAVSGTPAGRLSVVRYEIDRTDPDAGRVFLKTVSRHLVAAGQVDTTLPWAEGIHRTGTPDGRPNVMISVYGPPGRRLYVNLFDPETGIVRRRYPPRLQRRLWARRVLDTL